MAPYTRSYKGNYQYVRSRIGKKEKEYKGKGKEDWWVALREKRRKPGFRLRWGEGWRVSYTVSSLDDSSIWVWGHRYLSSKIERVIDSVMSYGVSQIDGKCVHMPCRAGILIVAESK